MRKKQRTKKYRMNGKETKKGRINCIRKIATTSVKTLVLLLGSRCTEMKI